MNVTKPNSLTNVIKTSIVNTTVTMESVNFEVSRATDITYWLNFLHRRNAAYNATKSKKAQIHLRERVLDGRSVFGVVDMMFFVGTYGSRANAGNVWRVLRDTSLHDIGVCREGDPFFG